MDEQEVREAWAEYEAGVISGMEMMEALTLGMATLSR